MEGILGMEALVVFSKLSLVMAEKREEPLSQVREWLNGQITITVARSYSWMIRGAWLPSLLRDQETGWDPESEIGLSG